MITLYFISYFLFLFMCVVLCGSILIQESKSLGLGASFGGDNSDSVFGTSTAEVLKRFTAYLAGAYLVTCLILSMWSGAIGRQEHGSSNTAITTEETQES